MTRDAAQMARRVTRVVSLKALSCVAVWGASFVATRIALETVTPVGLVALRFSMGTALLAILIKLRGGSMLPQSRDMPVCAALGGVLALHLLMQSMGLQYTSAINTGWIIGFIPVCIAVGAQMLRQQRLTPTGWAGVLVGMGGVLLVTLRAAPEFERARWGDLLQVASCLTWTVYTLAGARAIARSGALRVTALAMGVAAVICALATTATGVLRGPLTVSGVLAVMFLGLICSGLAYALWFSATREHGPSRVAAFLYIEPFVTLLAAAVILREPIMPNALAGGVVVLGGVWLVARGSGRPEN